MRQKQFEDAELLVGDRLEGNSIYRLLADHGGRLFPDDYFADLFTDSRRGRPTVAARVVATVMVLQAFEGLSDREATDRLAFDLRWQAACGLPAGTPAFHPTVLVGMRNRLRVSHRPRRLFTDTVALAREVGATSRRVRAIDSTPLHDAVATQDTVTQLRAAIRKVLRTAPGDVAEGVRAALRRDDDYATHGKPPCDWDDPEAREALVDALVRDARAALRALEGAELEGQAADDAALLALVAGQDVACDDDGQFRIARGVARDRVISTVDPCARHGHKSRHRRFDGYKTHLACDPDSEIITEVAVTPANAPDHTVAPDLTRDLAAQDDLESGLAEAGGPGPDTEGPEGPTEGEGGVEAEAPPPEGPEGDDEGPLLVGDAAYAHPSLRAEFAQQGIEVVAKVPPARNTGGRFTKDDFAVDPEGGTVRCPAGHLARIRPSRGGGGRAVFGKRCADCPLRPRCTTARGGRTIAIHPDEAILQQAKAAQRTAAWQARYKELRPVVERVIAHFTRRPWGGRRARTRGPDRIATDVDARAAALNLANLARLGLRWSPTGWAIT